MDIDQLRVAICGNKKLKYDHNTAHMRYGTLTVSFLEGCPAHHEFSQVLEQERILDFS